MVLMVIGWVVLSLALGVLVGKGIRRADVIGPSRDEPAWWELPTPVASTVDVR